MRSMDPSFTARPLSEMADAALDRARELGAEHADVRVERVRGQQINLRDAELDGNTDALDSGLCVRVVHDGTWGFASGITATDARGTAPLSAARSAMPDVAAR